VQPVRPRPWQSGEEDTAGELVEDVDDARLGDPDRIRQRARLADDVSRVVELESDVARIPDGSEAFELAARGDPACPVHRDHVLAELRRCVQRHVVAVLREVERRRDASVARPEHCHAHRDLLDVNRGGTLVARSNHRR
jgi:hypothetical protein